MVFMDDGVADPDAAKREAEAAKTAGTTIVGISLGADAALLKEVRSAAGREQAGWHASICGVA